MFSFFKTKKPSPSSSPETSDPIPSASDFVIVDPKQGKTDPVNPHPNVNPLYPNFGQNFGNPSVLPALPNRPPLQHSDSTHHTTYVHDIPFKLSSKLSEGNLDEITRIQVDDILSLITWKIGINDMEYDFTLERSLLQADTTDSSGSSDADEEAQEEAQEDK